MSSEHRVCGFVCTMCLPYLFLATIIELLTLHVQVDNVIAFTRSVDQAFLDTFNMAIVSMYPSGVDSSFGYGGASSLQITWHAFPQCQEFFVHPPASLVFVQGTAERICRSPADAGMSA